MTVFRNEWLTLIKRSKKLFSEKFHIFQKLPDSQITSQTLHFIWSFPAHLFNLFIQFPQDKTLRLNNVLLIRAVAFFGELPGQPLQ